MFKQIKRLAIVVSIILLHLFILANFARRNYVAPILMYHSVTPDAHPKNLLAVSDKVFDRQMSFLSRHHYNVISLRELTILIKDKKKAPPKTVVLTFDDGYKDNYAYAFPVLKKYNLPAALFIIFNEVGRSDRLSWDEIKAMQNSGLMEIGSHTLGPEPLIKIKSEIEVKSQIFDSKAAIEKAMGMKVTLFSYPEGRFTSHIRQLVVDAGYEAAVTTNPGKKFANDDIFALKRLRISSNCANMFIFWVESSGYYNFMREWRRKK